MTLVIIPCSVGMCNLKMSCEKNVISDEISAWSGVQMCALSSVGATGYYAKAAITFRTCTAEIRFFLKEATWSSMRATRGLTTMTID